jgi:hypothetical protein
MTYHVMEYLGDRGDYIIGWAFLEPVQYEKWKKSPDSQSRSVMAFCSIIGSESTSEFGGVPCFRLWDYFHTLAVPSRSSLKQLATGEGLEDAFVESERPPLPDGD